MRRAAKRDANEPEIIAALEKAGCEVWRINQEGLPDLLVLRAGQIHFLECKHEFRGRLTPAQLRNLERGLPFTVVTHPFEALHAVGLSKRDDWKEVRKQRPDLFDNETSEVKKNG